MPQKFELSFQKIWKADSPGRHLLEGPVYFKQNHCLFFTDFFQRKIYSLDLNRVNIAPKCVFTFCRQWCNGLTLKSDGSLVACTWERPACPHGLVWELSKNFSQAKPRVSVAQDGSKLRSPNDIAIDENGGVYFTDMRAGRVYYHRESGPAAKSCFSTKLDSPNGVTLGWESGIVNSIYISESVKSPFRKPTVKKFEILRPGEVGQQLACHKFVKGRRLDGMALSDNGLLLVAEEREVIVLDSQLKRVAGKPLCNRDRIIPSNVCFIGPKMFAVTSYRSIVKKSPAELFVGTLDPVSKRKTRLN